jgi:leucyl/phenylalanyl-tRNA--protein transferase
MTGMIPWLESSDPFPPLERALAEPDGLLAAGADLTPARLLAAYRSGIFPWYSAGQPVLWWSPDPRMVLFPGEFRMPRSLAKRLRRCDYEIRVDTAFETVIHACAAPRSDGAGTWITPDMIAAYCELHRLGHAHSVETWIDGELAGGLYGIALGRVFYGESMFARTADASKIALATLVHQLDRRQFGIIDCQMNTAHLARFGAREIPRREFSRHLAELVNYPQTDDVWRFGDERVNW